jgi:hypothetical protein
MVGAHADARNPGRRADDARRDVRRRERVRVVIRTCTTAGRVVVTAR